jgi:hypothetical protein
MPGRASTSAMRPTTRASALRQTAISSRAARYLWDVRTAAQNIAEFISGHGFDDYIADKMLRAAVERQC